MVSLLRCSNARCDTISLRVKPVIRTGLKMVPEVQADLRDQGVCKRTRRSLRDLNHADHFTQRFRAGLGWFAPTGLDF